MRIRYPALPWIRHEVDSVIKDFFLSNGKLTSYKKGDIVIPSNYIYPNLSLIVGGLLGKGFDIDDSNDFTHSILFAGSLVGTYYFMTKLNTGMKIIALRGTTLISVPHEVVYKKMMISEVFMTKMLKQSALDLASDSEGLAIVASKSADEKFKILMKGIIVRFRVQSVNGWYKMPYNLTHKEIARIIYNTPLTINRLFIKYTKAGYFKGKSTERYIHKSFFENMKDWDPSDPTITLA